MNELLRLIKIKDLPAGEAKIRADLGISVYAFGIDFRFTVWNKEFTFSFGAPILKT